MLVGKTFGMTLATLMLAAANGAQAHKTLLDAGLYAQYRMDGSGVIQMDVCGKLVTTHGCYGGSIFGSFEHACAVLDGTPHQKGNVITRAIYVFDKRTSATDDTILYVFKRKDTISDSFDDVKVTPVQQIQLPISGGAQAHCFAAANDAFVYVGTHEGSGVVAIDKASLTAAIAVNGHVNSISADDRGYVLANTDQLSEIFDPAGVAISGGGSSDYNLINTRSPWNPQQ